MQRVDDSNSSQLNKNRLAYALVTMAPTVNNIKEARDLIKNQPAKFLILKFMTRALAYREKVFEATQMIPDNISDSEHLDFLWNCEFGYSATQVMPTEWKQYYEYMFWNLNNKFIGYLDETN